MEELKKKRTQIKKGIIKLHKFITTPNVNQTDIKVRIDKFEEYYKKYCDIQDEIDDKCIDDKEIFTEDAYRNEIDELYFASKSIWVACCSENLNDTEGASASCPVENTDLTNLLQTMSTTLTSVVDLQSSSMQRISSHSEIRLPSIQIPDFDGNLSNWIRFRDLFDAMVDSKLNLADVEKLEYLQTKLKGEASSLIKHLTPTINNYTIAWDIIKKKYDKPEKIKESYIQLLLNQPSCKNGTLSEVKHFYNNTIECYNALKVLYESVDAWDPLLLFLMKEKLDRESFILWNRQTNENESQTFQKLIKFLEDRVCELENLEPKRFSKFVKGSKIATMASTTQSCPLCKRDHFLYSCQQFKDLKLEERINIVRNNGICFNCLRENHFYKDCKSRNCTNCNRKHNTLLCPSKHPSDDSDTVQQNKMNISPTSVTINFSQQITRYTTLLPTAIVMVRDKRGSLQPCRALIDTGAQATLISEACVQRLKLRKSFDKTVLYGVGGNTENYTRGKVDIEIFAEKTNKTIFVKTFCLSTLTQYLPSETVISTKLNYFQDLQLADPGYYKSNRIDIILGANVYPHCTTTEKEIQHPSGSPVAYSTIFGWILMGNVNKEPENSIVIAHIHTALDEQLQQFWEIEECASDTRYLSPDEEKAEKHFKDNFQKLQDGRYMVKLPFKTDSFQLGESKIAANSRLQSMERKFKNNANLKIEYHKFMNEYLQLDHMEIVSSEPREKMYHMPHHAVLKPSSTTTKLRVVFDASCKTSNNTSLNEHLLIGPTVQNDLYTILLKFRKFKIGFTADIEKMYRQVLIHPDDRSFQCILWRNSPNELLRTYQLKTITYGTAAAPFLATRTLQQVAFDKSTKFENESNEIINNFYVDDYMSCTPNLETAVSLRESLCSILSTSGFHLRKWSSNSEQFQNSIIHEDRACSSEMIINNSETVKTLGLLWNTKTDCFQYNVCFSPESNAITKRRVLSDISKIYDPIGWLSPIVIKLKIFMQRLWLLGINWDQDFPNDLKTEWLQLQTNIERIQDLQIPRWFNFNVGDHIELHGFSDSSELAYSAAIYVRVIKPDGAISTSLLTAKTRVTPIRQISLPRLELCAAHLMVKLMVKVRKALQFEGIPIYGWTDSTVVLAWISDHPRRWKTFIANRTSQIINIIPACQWQHISSKQNPADLATRGISSAEIINSTLWWKGPQILLNSSVQCSQSTTENIQHEIDLEERKVVATVIPNVQTDIFHLYSSYSKLLRVTALLLRFVKNSKSKFERNFGAISALELDTSHQVLVRKSQQQSYEAELKMLSAKDQLPSGNKLAGLTPFIDKTGLLRVGGRLENALISYDQKHPYILHKNNTLTQLIVRYYHLKHLHAGTRQLQYILSQKYWIPDVTKLIKQVVYQCTTCMRFRQKTFQQRMGNLPSCRLQPGSAFLYVGIDFAGPMLVRSWKGRGSKTYKCWIAVFVCLNTKAIHVEAVTDLSTQTFLASLRRFTSRRGKPLHIYTDNGTNFVGCNQELKELYQFLTSHNLFIEGELSNEQIQWHFIPPSAPNFGGIWEAGVKSVKFHLKRVLGNSSTTYEELNTLLCQIECCLNSRPLCLKFEGDSDPLTPAHFLILRPMFSIPDENLIEANVNRLTRWQFIQSLLQQFWSRWSKEYLSQLQKRPKWLQKLQNLQKDDMVIVKDDNLPPTHWLIGRIMETHPGNDGIVRVVSIKTKKGLFKRPVSKLCPLFIDC